MKSDKSIVLVTKKNSTVKNKEEYMNSWVIKIEDSWLNPLIK